MLLNRRGPRRSALPAFISRTPRIADQSRSITAFAGWRCGIGRIASEVVVAEPFRLDTAVAAEGRIGPGGNNTAARPNAVG
ncbi:hypothetical protein AW168_24145 [Nocardia brasiliensis]|nr:hypothetical protein AW168_24145 [Nocardia brasiliensis]